MKTKQIKAGLVSVVLGAMSPLAMVLPASAATITWTGLEESWSNSDSWDSGFPGSGDTVVFPASANYQISEIDYVTSFDIASIIFNGEVSGTSSKSYELRRNGSFGLSSSIEAIMTGSGGDHQVKSGIQLNDNVTFRTTGSNTLTIGDGESVLDLGSNDLTLNASGGSIVLAGKIAGSGNIIKSGSGKTKVMTTPDTGGYTGGVTVSEGEFSVEDNLGLNVVINGGTLKGTGMVGTVSMSGGAIAPGASPGVINTGNLTLTGGTYEVELGGTADGEYDQTNVTGTVDLGSATTLDIALFGGYEPQVNDVFTIINNDGSDAINGTFNGIANGDRVTVGGYTYQVNYDAGDGNDVRVLVTGTPSAPDTGIGSVISNPMLVLLASVLALVILGALRYADNKGK